jgi:small subunit ribosomal protein S21
LAGKISNLLAAETGAGSSKSRCINGLSAIFKKKVWTEWWGKRYIDEFPSQNSYNTPFQRNGVFVVKLNVREKESIQEAVRRFRKLVERSGIKKEMRRREYYEKPSETRRRARLRAERRTRPRKII